MKNLKHYFHKAQRENWAIGQFNFSTFEQAKGIVQAAYPLRSPIILGTSEGESRFVGLAEAAAMRDLFRKKTRLPIFLNLDHGKSFEYVREAILAGYDMVCFDGSKLPLEENIKISREVVKFAQWRGAVVEGEVGRFGTDASRVYQETFEIKEEYLTKTEEALRYLKETRVNVLAVSVGTFHGIDIRGVSPHIRLERLEEINEALRQAQGKPMGFVLHGGSGTPEEDIKKAIELGVCKINTNTEIRLAFTSAMRKALAENPDEITPHKYLGDSIEAVEQVVEEKIKLFGSGGKA